jgi:uridine kinase
LLIQHIQNLKNGNAANVPNYDFATHMRTKEVSVVQPKLVVIVEGILIFSDPHLVKELDIKVFVDADADVRFIRRLQRDISERGRTAQQVMDQYLQTVKPMHEKFVEPSKKVADLVIMSDQGNDPEVAMGMIVHHLKSISGLNYLEFLPPGG